MSSTEQVAFVFQVVLALGPLALYFLGLGLVNSQGRPCIVNARVDFALLAGAAVPVMVLPVLALATRGQLWLAGAAVAGLAVVSLAMIPSRTSGWVIYNVEARQCRRLVERTCRRLGWTLREEGGRWVVEGRDLVLALSVMPWLRSVTVQILRGDRVAGKKEATAWLGGLAEEISFESMLPSPVGASLVLIGVGLLGVPMWYLVHHMATIVEVVRELLFA